MSARILSCATGAARLWVRLYTAGLPAEARHARRTELDSDLWEQESAEHAAGRRLLWTALDVLRRFLVGMPADVRWRRQQGGARLLRRLAGAAVAAARGVALGTKRNVGLGIIVLVIATLTSAMAFGSRAEARTNAYECTWLGGKEANATAVRTPH